MEVLKLCQTKRITIITRTIIITTIIAKIITITTTITIINFKKDFSFKARILF